MFESLARLEALQKAQHECDEYKKLYTHLREENERLKRGLLGKTEKLPPNDAQLSLAILGLMLGGGQEPAPTPADEEPTRVIPEHTHKVPKRRGSSDDWPSVYIEFIPPEGEREELDAFHIIGQETRDVLERRPASCVFVYPSSSPTRSHCPSQRVSPNRACSPRRSSNAVAMQQ